VHENKNSCDTTLKIIGNCFLCWLFKPRYRRTSKLYSFLKSRGNSVLLKRRYRRTLSFPPSMRTVYTGTQPMGSSITSILQ